MPKLEPAMQVLWSSRSGTLIVPDSATTLHFIIDSPHSRLLTILPGTIIKPASPDDQTIIDGTLFIPREDDDALQLHVQATAVTEHDAGHAADRFAAHHGMAHKGSYVSLEILGGKFDGVVLDDEDLNLANPLTVDGHDTKLLRQLNTDKAQLARIAQQMLGFEVFEPLAVAADPRGVHLRTRAGIYRLAFTPQAMTYEAATNRISELMRANG